MPIRRDVAIANFVKLASGYMESMRRVTLGKDHNLVESAPITISPRETEIGRAKIKDDVTQGRLLTNPARGFDTCKCF
jgi:hypothetical protein